MTHGPEPREMQPHEAELLRSVGWNAEEIERVAEATRWGVTMDLEEGKQSYLVQGIEPTTGRLLQVGIGYDVLWREIIALMRTWKTGERWHIDAAQMVTLHLMMVVGLQTLEGFARFGPTA